MRRFFAFLSGVIAGALVGMTTALLLAPMSGNELRSEATTRFESTFDSVRNAVEEERQRLETELEAFKRGEIKIG